MVKKFTEEELKAKEYARAIRWRKANWARFLKKQQDTRRKRYANNPEFRKTERDRYKKWMENGGKEYHKNYVKTRRVWDVSYKLSGNMRGRIRAALRGKYKASSMVNLVGCSMENLKTYLQSKFIEGMTWENYGKWHVDHIIPCSSFDMTNEQHQKQCFHYTNLQPLWALDNWSKGNKRCSVQDAPASCSGVSGV
jgi:hypothetical protein